MSLFHTCSWDNCSEIASNICKCNEIATYLCKNHLADHMTNYPSISHEMMSILIQCSQNDNEALKAGLELYKKQFGAITRESLNRKANLKNKYIAEIKAIDDCCAKEIDNMIKCFKGVEEAIEKLTTLELLDSSSSNFLVSEIIDAKQQGLLDETTVCKIIELNAHYKPYESLSLKKTLQMNDQDFVRALQTNDYFLKNYDSPNQNHLGNIVSIAISPCDQLLVIGFSSSFLALFSLENREILDICSDGYSKESNILFSNDGIFIAYGCLENELGICYIIDEKLEPYKKISTELERILHLDLSLFNGICVACSDSSKAFIIDINEENRAISLENKETESQSYLYFFQNEKRTGINSLKFSNLGDAMAIGYDNGSIIIWNALDGVQKSWLKNENKQIKDLKFSPCDRYVAVFSSCISIWNLATGQSIRQIEHINDIINIDFSRCGSSFIYNLNGSVKFRNIRSNQEVLSIETKTSQGTDKEVLTNLQTSKDKRHLAVYSASEIQI